MVGRLSEPPGLRQREKSSYSDRACADRRL